MHDCLQTAISRYLMDAARMRVQLFTAYSLVITVILIWSLLRNYKRWTNLSISMRPAESPLRFRALAQKVMQLSFIKIIVNNKFRKAPTEWNLKKSSRKVKVTLISRAKSYDVSWIVINWIRSSTAPCVACYWDFALRQFMLEATDFWITIIMLSFTALWHTIRRLSYLGIITPRVDVLWALCNSSEVKH